MKILINLILGHAVADYGLQTAYMAQNKSSNVIVLLAHCLIHGFVTTQILQQQGVKNATALGVAETIAHTAIDSAKCNSVFGEATDQALHIACKAAITLLAKRGERC